MNLRDAIDEFLSTHQEIHYFLGGLLLGIVIGMWLAVPYIILVINNT